MNYKITYLFHNQYCYRNKKVKNKKTKQNKIEFSVCLGNF